MPYELQRVRAVARLGRLMAPQPVQNRVRAVARLGRLTAPQPAQNRVRAVLAARAEQGAL